MLVFAQPVTIYIEERLDGIIVMSDFIYNYYT